MTQARTLDRLDRCREQPPAVQCELLAHALQRLAPDRRDPERYHLDRAELVSKLRRLGRRLGQVPA